MRKYGSIIEGEDVDDLCLCGRGRLHEGFTELKVRVQNTHLVIKNVPARICDQCDEAYISPETSRQIEEVVENYRADRLEVNDSWLRKTKN